jgi:L-lactate dehydrogenase complex protein LldG
MNTSGRDNILKKISLALTQSTPSPFPGVGEPDAYFQAPTGPLPLLFGERFMALQGRLVRCANDADASTQLQLLCAERGWTKVYSSLEQWKEQLPAPILSGDIVTCDAALTGCEVLVARTGTMVLTALTGGRITSVYTPVHICIAYASQVVFDISAALQFLGEKYGSNLPSFVSFATGPSRTADIEKTLVVGVHGPGEVYCFLIDDGA